MRTIFPKNPTMAVGFFDYTRQTRYNTGMLSIPKKTTFLPISGLVDISEVLPIIDSPQFQRLRHIKQLALIHLEHAGATHTRFEHSLGVYALTKKVVARLELSPTLTHALPIFGLLHDVGHGAYSHTLEPLLVGEHKKQTVAVIHSLKKKIERTGASFALIEKLARHATPEYAIVSDKNLGTDKLDYLERDAYHLGWPVTLPKDTVIHHLMWLQKQKKLAVEEKAIEQVITIQNRYFEQYLQIYLRKISTITTRMLQRAVWEDGRRKLFAASTDPEVFGALLTSPSALAQQLAEGLRERALYKTILTIKRKGYERAERTAKKDLSVIAVGQSEIYKLLERAKNQDELVALENKLATTAGLREGELLIASPGPIGKLSPSPLPLYNVSTKKITPLFTLRPGHARAIEERLNEALAVRVCVAPRKRKAASRHARKLMRILA